MCKASEIAAVQHSSRTLLCQISKVGIQWNLSKADTIGTNKNHPLWRGCHLVRGLLYIMWAITFIWDPVTVHYEGEGVL